MEILSVVVLYTIAMLLSAALRRRETLLIAMIPCLAVLSNILGSAKILSMPFGLSAPAGIIPFMLSFFLLDVINEFFGEEKARGGMISGLIAVGMSVVVIEIVLLWRPAPFSATGLSDVFYLSPRLFLASLVSFGVASYLNIRIYSAIRNLTGKGVLWLRENVSTIVSILASNLIFIPLGYLGTGYPLANMIVGHTIAQTIIALLDTPFIYGIRHIYERMDLREARERLKSVSFVVIKDGSVVFESTDRGLKPFVKAIESTNLKGALIGDRMVGRASAMLACYSEPSAIYTLGITKEALAILNSRRIKVVYDAVIEMPSCIYDATLKGVEEPEEAYRIVKEMTEDES